MTSPGWLGRRPKGMRDTHSFKTFVANCVRTKEGREILRRRHGGYGLNGRKD